MADHPILFIALAIVIGVALAGAIVWAALPWPSAVDCVSSSSGQTPLQAVLAFGGPVEQTVGLGHWYNFTLASVGGDFKFNNLKFQTQSAAGSTIVPGPSWNLTVLSPAATWLGTYALTGPTAEGWTMGGFTALLAGQSFDLLVTPGNISGDSFVITEIGSLTDGCPALGSVSIGIQ